MGLDVTLYKKGKDFELGRKKEKEFASGINNILESVMKGKEYDSLTKADKSIIEKKEKELRAKLSVNTFGEDESLDIEKKVEIDSEKYPEHYWKIGYFRSSYNDSGINSVLTSSIGKDLYYIFPEYEDYESQSDFLIDWESAKTRAKEVFDEYKKFLELSGNCTIGEFSLSQIDELKIPKSKKEASDFYLQEVEEAKKSEIIFNSFLKGSSQFHLKEPLKVRAIIQGQRECFFGSDMQSVIYLIIENQESIENNHYLQALEILIETIDYVLKQDKPQSYYFDWSA